MLPATEPFRSLHRLPLPTWQAPFAAYFVGVLGRSPQYTGLAATLAELAAAEREEGAGGPQRHFEALQRFFAGAPGRFAALAELPAAELRERNALAAHRGETLLQIDLQEANYQVLARHSGGELPPTWAELCARLGVPAWFAASKVKRQQLLGLFEPRAQVRAQRRYTADIVARLEAAGMEPVFVSHDEVIARGPGPLAALPLDGVRVRQRLLRETVVDGTQVRELTLLPDGPPHRTLFAVPRHQFFRRFKEIVLGEPAIDADDLFMFEGELCLPLGAARLADLARTLPG